MEEKLIPVAFGLVLGGVISFLSFRYKLRIEVKSKVNQALFHLLEIWSLLGTVKFLQSDYFTEKLMGRIKERFPEVNFDDASEEGIKAGMAIGLPLLINAKSHDEEFYLDKYTALVHDLAAIYPVQAFQLNKNQILIKYLEGLDSLISESENNDIGQDALNRMKNFVNEDSFKEFEKDLITLSKKSGYANKRAVGRSIQRAKNRLTNIPDTEFDDIIDQVIAPIIQAHSDPVQ